MKSIASFFFLLFVVGTTVSFSQNPISNLEEENTIIESTEESKNHKTLLAAVRAADLDETLNGEGPFTVFAPSDIAFKKLTSEKVTYLLRPENKKELHAMVTYHIVAGNLTASKILRAMCRGAGSATFTTVQGDEIKATMDGIDIVLTDSFGNTAKITVADSNQRNGVIHEIDSVILPSRS